MVDEGLENLMILQKKSARTLPLPGFVSPWVGICVACLLELGVWHTANHSHDQWGGGAAKEVAERGGVGSQGLRAHSTPQTCQPPE